MCQITEILNEYPKRSGKTIEELADLLGYEAPSTLGRHLNPNDHHRPFPLSKLIPIIKATGDFSALDHIEKRLGRVAIAITGNAIGLNLQSVATLAKEAGEAIATVADALSDGKVTSEEKKNCTKELIELSAVVNGLLLKLME